MQPFRVRHPVDGTAVEMANMIIHWQPETKDRLLIARTTTPGRAPIRIPSIRGPFIGVMTVPAA